MSESILLAWIGGDGGGRWIAVAARELAWVFLLGLPLCLGAEALTRHHFQIASRESVEAISNPTLRRMALQRRDQAVLAREGDLGYFIYRMAAVLVPLLLVARFLLRAARYLLDCWPDAHVAIVRMRMGGALAAACLGGFLASLPPRIAAFLVDHYG